MKTRLLSLFLTVAVLLSCMAVTVGATEVDVEQAQLINLLEFGTPNDSGNMWVQNDTSGFASATFSLPYSTLIRYVDMVVSSQRGLDAAYLVVGSSRTALTVEPISGSTYFRIYGVFGGGWSDKLTIEFDTTTTSVGYIQFYSIHMSAQPAQLLSSPSTFLLEDQSVVQTAGNSLVTLEAYLNAPFDGALPWTSSVRNNEWRKYDYMTFTLSYWTHSISNINVQIAGKPVPYVVNTVENPPGFDSNPDDGSYTTIENIYSISITVDLSGIERTVSGELIVTIQGLGTSVTASLHDGCGYIPADLPEAEVTWLQRIWQALDGDTSASDEYQEEMESQADAMEDAVDQMDAVTKPPVDNIDVSVDSFVDADAASAAGDVIGQLMGNNLILTMSMISVTVALVAYIVFGKKG